MKEFWQTMAAAEETTAYTFDNTFYEACRYNEL